MNLHICRPECITGECIGSVEQKAEINAFTSIGTVHGEGGYGI